MVNTCTKCILGFALNSTNSQQGSLTTRLGNNAEKVDIGITKYGPSTNVYLLSALINQNYEHCFHKDVKQTIT